MTITKLTEKFNQIIQASQVLKQARLKSLLYAISRVEQSDRRELLASRVIDEINCGSVELTELINGYKEQSA